MIKVAFVFSFVFEVARHVAVLFALDTGLSTTVELLPESIFGAGLRLTNLHLLNATFSTSMILSLRLQWVQNTTKGKQFVMISSPVNLHPTYAIVGEGESPLSVEA